MKINKTCDIYYYLELIESNTHFAFAGYSDAEWYCMFGDREGSTTGLGQTLSHDHGKKLLDVLKRRQNDPAFIIGVPGCLESLPAFCNGRVNAFLQNRNLTVEGYERDMVTDELAEQAELYPLIKTLREQPLILIGNKYLREIGFLKPDIFAEINSPNLHMEENAIEKTVQSIIDAASPQREWVFAISAGVSSAIIIDQLYDEFPNSCFLDLGSMWDAFVGIGGQREWRRKLYANPEELIKWKRRNLREFYKS